MFVDQWQNATDSFVNSATDHRRFPRKLGMLRVLTARHLPARLAARPVLRQPSTRQLAGGQGGNTMENVFKAIQGGDEAAKAKAAEFADRVTTGDPLSGFSDDEVKESAAILQQLSPEQRQRAMAASIQNVKTNMTDSERSSLNDMLKQRQAGQGMVDITRSGENVQPGSGGGAESAGSIDDLLGGLLGGGAGGAGLDDLLGGLLGGGGGSSQSGGGGLGDILGGLLGGGDDRGQSRSGGGGGLGDVLGGLLGGGDDTQTGAIEQPSGGGGLGGALGDIMSGPMGKAIIAGAAAYAMKEFMG
jgi:hypothetical protein